MSLKLLVAGWKSVSLVDVHGHPAFTLWLCGCNLKCPFCHNWRLAETDPLICKWLSIDHVYEEVIASKSLVDYFHVTGGEPLIRHTTLKHLFQMVKESGLLTSLNSNLTLYEQFKELVENGLIDHVATDLKIPPNELYGLPQHLVEKLWTSFIKSLQLVKQTGIWLELRIPLHRGLSPDYLDSVLYQLVNYINHEKTVIILNQLIGEPLVKPRNPSWVRENATISRDLIEELIRVLRSHGFSAIYVKSVEGFQH